jgi:hypothetical protein
MFDDQFPASVHKLLQMEFGSGWGDLIIVVIKRENRQLLADFVNNLTKEQRSEILYKLLKTLSTTKNILNEEEMEKFREQLDGDLAKNAQGRANAA